MSNMSPTRLVIGCLCCALVIAIMYMLNASPAASTTHGSPTGFRTSSSHGQGCPGCVRRKAEDILSVDPQVQKMVEQLVEAQVPANDGHLVQVIRDYFIDKPRPFLTKFSMPIFQTEQAKAADKILNKDRGFFVECGGLDGERSSNTNWLEQTRGWNGLLIEMDPSYYLQIRGKNRKCYSINACLSPEPHPAIVPFKEHKMGEGKLQAGAAGGADDPAVHDSYCFPLLSMMLALNTSHIDYFSLDVEGLEMPILRTIPFDVLDISVVTVEFSHQDNKNEMVALMQSKGYRLDATLHASKPEIYYGCDDYVFVKKNL